MGFVNGQVHLESNSHYHGRREISASMVKALLSSPEEFEWLHILGHRKDSTPAMDFGSAIHEDQLMGIWDQSWVEIPREVLDSTGARRGNAWKAFQRENEGKVLLKSDQLDRMKILSERMAKNPIAAELLGRKAEGLSEISITAEAPLQDGSMQKVRGRLDLLLPDCIVDLKTISDLDDRTRRFRPFDHGWHVQAVMYQLLVNAVRGGELLPVYFIAVETSVPYRVEVLRPTQDTLSAAALLLQDAIEEIVERIKSGNWHREKWPEPFEF